jgi:hypothetical protein
MAFLHIAGLIHHQHRAGITQVLHDIAPHVIANAIGVPPRAGQQCCIPSGVPGMLGDRPAVLPRQVSQQPQHERPRLPPRLHPAEPARDPAHQIVEHPQPAGRVYAMACGHRKIFLSRHKPG